MFFWVLAYAWILTPLFKMGIKLIWFLPLGIREAICGILTIWFVLFPVIFILLSIYYRSIRKAYYKFQPVCSLDEPLEEYNDRLCKKYLEVYKELKTTGWDVKEDMTIYKSKLDGKLYVISKDTGDEMKKFPFNLLEVRESVWQYDGKDRCSYYWADSDEFICNNDRTIYANKYFKDKIELEEAKAEGYLAYYSYDPEGKYRHCLIEIETKKMIKTSWGNARLNVKIYTDDKQSKSIKEFESILGSFYLKKYYQFVNKKEDDYAFRPFECELDDGLGKNMFFISREEYRKLHGYIALTMDRYKMLPFAMAQFVYFQNLSSELIPIYEKEGGYKKIGEGCYYKLNNEYMENMIIWPHKDDVKESNNCDFEMIGLQELLEKQYELYKEEYPQFM